MEEQKNQPDFSLYYPSEYTELKKKLEETRERVKDNPEEALKTLQRAGIVNKSGKLAWPYNGAESPTEEEIEWLKENNRWYDD